jgi:hypothetical protein
MNILKNKTLHSHQPQPMLFLYRMAHLAQDAAKHSMIPCLRYHCRERRTAAKTAIYVPLGVAVNEVEAEEDLLDIQTPNSDFADDAARART